jgi:hypothetical protein
MLPWPLSGLQPLMLRKYGAVGGMTIGKGYRRTQRKNFPPQFPDDLTWNRTAVVGWEAGD